MTDTVTLHTAFANYPHVRAIKDGTVASPRIRFDFEDVPAIARAFRRMVRTLDFDLCEIALNGIDPAAVRPVIANPMKAAVHRSQGRRDRTKRGGKVYPASRAGPPALWAGGKPHRDRAVLAVRHRTGFGVRGLSSR